MKSKSKSHIFKKKWLSLSPTEKVARVRALEVFRLIKEGRSLYSASESVGIDPRTAKAQLGVYLFKRKHRWHARPRNHIERALIIYEKGRITQILIKDSETASLIGRYLNDAKKVLVSGDKILLKQYRNVLIKDTNGKKHRLEVRPAKIEEIELSREDVEFSDIYAY